MTLACSIKELWVVSKARKVLQKCSPFNIYFARMEEEHSSAMGKLLFKSYQWCSSLASLNHKYSTFFFFFTVLKKLDGGLWWPECPFIIQVKILQKVPYSFCTQMTFLLKCVNTLGAEPRSPKWLLLLRQCFVSNVHAALLHDASQLKGLFTTALYQHWPKFSLQSFTTRKHLSGILLPHNLPLLFWHRYRL